MSLLLPFLVSVAVSLGTLHLLYRKKLNFLQNELQLNNSSFNSSIKSRGLALLSAAIILLMFVGCFVGGYFHFPVSLILIPTSVILALCAKFKRCIEYKALFKATPFSIIFFAFGMFLIILGLEKIGLAELLETILRAFNQLGGLLSTICTGIFAGLLSCIGNNLPAVMINSIAISNLELSSSNELLQVLANIIGCDIGPKLFPIGSLATLLWLHLLEKKGILVSYKRFIKVGFVLTIPTLVVTLVSLYFSVRLFGN